MKRICWNSWSEYLNVRETDTFEESPENFAVETKSDVMKLPYKDKDLFGFCSEFEEFYLVICKVCGKRIKPQSLIFHMELRHNVSEDVFSHSDSNEETSNLTDALPSSSKENSDKEDSLLKTNSKNWSPSLIKGKAIISNPKHAVYVQPYPKPSSIEACQGNSYGKISPCRSSYFVRTSLAKAFKSDNSESLSNTYIREVPSTESSLSACDSQASIVFLHPFLPMPNMKLCDIQDECADNLKCLNSETWSESSCLSEAPLLTQIIPENIGSPSQNSEIHQLNTEVADWNTEVANWNTEVANWNTDVADWNTEVADWNTEQNSTSLNLNGMATYSEWNEHASHFRPLSPDVQISQVVAVLKPLNSVDKR